MFHLTDLIGNRVRLNSDSKTRKPLIGPKVDAEGKAILGELTLEEEIAFFAKCKSRSSTIDITASPSPPSLPNTLTLSATTSLTKAPSEVSNDNVKSTSPEKPRRKSYNHTPI